MPQGRGGRHGLENTNTGQGQCTTHHAPPDHDPPGVDQPIPARSRISQWAGAMAWKSTQGGGDGRSLLPWLSLVATCCRSSLNTNGQITVATTGLSTRSTRNAASGLLAAPDATAHSAAVRSAHQEEGTATAQHHCQPTGAEPSQHHGQCLPARSWSGGLAVPHNGLDHHASLGHSPISTHGPPDAPAKARRVM